MDTLNLWIKYRPLRIGWCLRTGDFEGLRKTLRFTHTMWGGRYNPIIPVDNYELSNQLIKLFRVDFLLSLEDNEVVNTFIEQFNFLPNPLLHSKALFLRSGPDKVYPLVLDIYHPIRLIYNEQFKNNPNPTFQAMLYEWDDADPLSDIMLATFGDFPKKLEIGIDYQELIEKSIAGEKIKLVRTDPLPEDVFQKYTPNWICCLNLQPHHSIINHWDKPGFYVGEVNNFDDLVNYWNLRATDTELLFYDPANHERLEALKASYINALQTRPKKLQSFHEGLAIWSRRDHEPFDLGVFGKGLTRCSLDNAIWNGLNVKAPLMHFGEKSILAAVGQSYGKIKVSFSLPEKPFFDEIYTRRQHFVASIHPFVGLIGNERYTLVTPFWPYLNEYFGRELFFQWNKARVEPEGVGIIITIRNDSLNLYALEISSLITKIFEIAGIRAQHSKPGLIASRLIQQLEGLQSCRVFKIVGVRTLIEKYNPDQSFTRSDANKIIGQIDPETGRPNFSDYENLYIEPRTKAKPDNVFAYLVKNGVFRVGLRFTCPSCFLDFWITLDESRTLTKCEYCGQEFNVTTQLKDRDWRYRRSGLFGREDNQEGAIPVVLTLQQLDTVLHDNNMIYTTGMELISSGASIKKCETDFIILTQDTPGHKVQMAIGECKNRLEITADDVTKLKLVSEALDEKGIEVFVVFAKLTEFTSEELERCRAINGEFKRRLILLTKRELEPYFIYEKTAKEFEIPEYAISLEDMAHITHTVFYEKVKK
jgi:hypothetical protein